MDDLESLELLSLVSKVTSELQNHLGVSDKTLAEFIISQHSTCSSLPEFKKLLEELGAEFPRSLIESVDRLILTMHPKYKNVKKVKDEEESVIASLDEIEKKTRIFKGLALPDREAPWKEEEYTDGKGVGISSKLDAIDDTLALLENLEGKTRTDNPNGSDRRRIAGSSTGDYGEEYTRGRSERTRYRSRSRSSERGGKRRRGGFYGGEDGLGRARNGYGGREKDRGHYRDEDRGSK